jgi:hypothetical protein
MKKITVEITAGLLFFLSGMIAGAFLAIFQLAPAVCRLEEVPIWCLHDTATYVAVSAGLAGLGLLISILK